MERAHWRFTDDRGRLFAAERAPSRVTAYLQAGTSLWDHGLRPDAVFGSPHDGAGPDRTKTGSLPLSEVCYLGAGSALDLATLLDGDPELVVAVSYGGGQVYGLEPDTAEQLEQRVPLVVVDVSGESELTGITARFAALARSLGAEPGARAAGALEEAGQALRAAAEAPGTPGVLALSPAGPDQVHLARPGAWPQLRSLAGHGVKMVEPPEGSGRNWCTTGWDTALALRPRVVLTDVRSNAAPLDRLRDSADWRALEDRALLVPWNPEDPCSPQAHARLLARVAAALHDGCSG